MALLLALLTPVPGLPIGQGMATLLRGLPGLWRLRESRDAAPLYEVDQVHGPVLDGPRPLRGPITELLRHEEYIKGFSGRA